jgi:hypothetical protein
MNNKSYVPSSAPVNIQESVKRVRDLLKKEDGYLSIANQNKLEAMMVAYDIGEIIEKEVLGAYGEKRMPGFANLCGFKSLKTAYNYLYLYRAAGHKELLSEHNDLPLTFWYAIGSSIKWSSDMLGDMVRRSLLQYPLWKQSENEEPSDNIDMEKLGEVCKALKDLRNDFKQDGILYAYQAYELHLGKAPKGMDEMNKWFANRKATAIYTPRAEETHMEGFSFINERMPIPENKWQDICYLINFNRKDDQAITESLERIVEFQIAVSGISGWTHFSMDIGTKTKAINEKYEMKPTTEDRSYKSIKWEMEKKNRLHDIRQQAPNIESVELKDKLIFGSCLEVLKSKAFSKRSIDACLTDSPYGEEVYYEWREHTKVYHHEPKTTKEAAELLGSVAQVLVNREIIKEQFAWFSFVPIDWVHIFLPPV